MAKVTLVEPQKKNPKRFNIFLDGQFAFGADEDTIVEFRLVPGKEIRTEDLEKILFETEVGKLMARMYGLFNIRIRSEKEIRDKLRIKSKEEYSDLVIESLIGKLREKGMLNDLEFAKSWVESRRRSKLKGEKALKMELFQKGINREIIDEVFIHQSSVVSEEELAEKALEKKLDSWKNLSKLDFKKRAFGFLGRKGFDFQVISQVVEKAHKKGYN